MYPTSLNGIYTLTLNMLMVIEYGITLNMNQTSTPNIALRWANCKKRICQYSEFLNLNWNLLEIITWKFGNGLYS